jgi:uncharacterized membrane protein
VAIRFVGGNIMATSLARNRVAPSQALAVRRIETEDLMAALRRGYEDFTEKPSHLLFLGLIYPLFGLVLAGLTFSAHALTLLFPLVSGFALMGPFVALGLYEVSRRRELKLATSPDDVLAILSSPARGPILGFGILLLVILACWLASAVGLYHALYGARVPEPFLDFLGEVLTTPRGWALIILGHAIGFLFALVVFSATVISFPLILDRHVAIGTAILTSVEVVRTNPRTMGIWAFIIAAGLMIGSIPLLVGLAIVLPILGHATWHLYRRAVVAG